MNVMSNLNSNSFANNFDFLNLNDNFEYPANIRENSIKITKHQNTNKNNSNNGNILNLVAKFNNLKLSDQTSKQNTRIPNNTRISNTRSNKKSNNTRISNNNSNNNSNNTRISNNNSNNQSNHNVNNNNMLNLVSKFDTLKIYDNKRKKVQFNQTNQ